MNTQRTYSRILLADDGSEHAQAAVRLLCDLSLDKKTPLTVLRAFPSIEAAEAYDLEEKLHKTCMILQTAGFSPQAELVLGSPAEMIIEYASAHQPQLILLGAKGLRATFGILLGGVAQQVVEYACCPVLIVRAPYSGLKKILFVTDGSSFSEYAANYLSLFPLPKDSEIIVMHVTSPLYQSPIAMEEGQVSFPSDYPGSLQDRISEARIKAEQDGEKILETTSKLLSGVDSKISMVKKEGDAATEIIEYSNKEKIDLLVTGSRGLSQMRAWLLGSVSRKLVHYSNSSILVVRKPVN